MDTFLMKRIAECEKAGKKQVIKTWSRRSTIVPEFVGYTFAIHNGRRISFGGRPSWNMNFNP